MPRQIILCEAEIELLREACSAKGRVVRVAEEGEIQARVWRGACALHLTKLGFFESVGDGWRIKPDLKGEVVAILEEFD